MQNFTFNCKTEFVFGKETELSVGTEVKKYSKKILLHYGGGHIKKTGLYDKVLKSLKDNDIDYIEQGGVRANPYLNLVREGIEICKEEKIDFILAVGGGSVIDSAKAIGVGVINDGDIWDYFMGKKQVQGMLNIGVILTIPATGSESSDCSVLTNSELKLKKPLMHSTMKPVFAILNPELTYSLSDYQTTMGCIDILAHVFERYFTKEKNVELTDRLCEGTIKTVINNLNKVKKNPKDYNARAEIMWAGTIANNGVLGTGRIEEWASHILASPISGIYDITHGATLSIIIPAWMEYVYIEDINRFAQFAIRVWNVDEDLQNLESVALEGIRRTKEFFRSVGAPVSFEDIGIGKDLFEQMAEQCTVMGPVGNFKEINKVDAVKIYEIALEG